jgi:HD superfamily phosphohydrolase
LLKLLSHPEFRAYFSKKELEEALIAILLSKLVSFVFDYVFFELFLSNNAEEDAAGRRERLNLFLSMRSSGSKKSLNDVIKHEFPDIDLELVIAILCGVASTESRQARLISGIIKSSIDVRVLDYLGRDSHHTGIPPGEGIDIDHIVNSLTWAPADGSLGITRIGVHSVEHLLCARYWMYNRVYWNQINRSLASMVRYTIYALIKAGDLTANHFIREVMNLDEPSALEWLHESWDATAGEKYRYASVLSPLRLPRPRPYRLLLELSGMTWSKKHISAARKLTPDQLEEIRIEFIQSSSLANKLSIADVLFDIPRDKVLKLGEDVQVETERGKWERLRDISDIVRTLPDAFLETGFKFRVFLNGELPLNESEKSALAGEAREFLGKEIKPNDSV